MDREQIRTEVRGYASIAAGTIYAGIPREDIPDDLWHDLKLMKDQYDYQQHGNMKAKHAGLITERILDAVSICGTPEEVIPRFRELIALGVENFVLPIATNEPDVMINILAEHVIPHLQADS